MNDRLQLLRRTIACRARYWWRRLCHALGYCHKCGEPVDRTRSGAYLCPLLRCPMIGALAVLALGLWLCKGIYLEMQAQHLQREAGR